MPVPSDAATSLDRAVDLNVTVIIRRARWTVLSILFALLVMAIGFPLSGLVSRVRPLTLISVVFFLKQDLPLLPLFFVPLLVQWRENKTPAFAHSLHRRHVEIAVAILLLLVCWWGHYAILDGWHLSRDEQMADFDAAIFDHGRLFWPIPIEWRRFAPALNQIFILPIGNHEAWVSAYLPVNAALRALVGSLADPALTSPLLVAAGALALWRITGRLFPEAPSARIVTLILYAGSSQILLTGMTPFAMSGHLACNLLWLALFLRGDRRGHAGAMAIGFLATGLHQPLFHPLFVLPFLDVLRRERRWALLAAYLVAYAAIGLFWMAWPLWISGHGTTRVSIAADAAGIGYVARLRYAIGLFDPNAAWLMAVNLIRFATWQHLLLLPLMAVGIAVGFRRDSIARALAIGFLLPIVFMAVLLAPQGFGWGYRYLHGVIGSACLLAGYGWRWLEVHRRAPCRLLFWTSVVSLAVLFPVHAWMAHRTVKPSVDLDRHIAAIHADVAIIDDDAAPFADDLVINQPDLSNRPIRLRASKLSPAQVAVLCRHFSVAFVDAPEFHALDTLYGRPALTAPTAWQAALKTAAINGHCLTDR